MTKMGLHFAGLLARLLALSVVTGCTSSPELPSGISRSPDGQGFCCPPAGASCDCRSRGGFAMEASACTFDFNVVCDAHPNDWISTTDAHGCLAYTTRSWPSPTTSCFPVRLDTGSPDASFVDVGARDASLEDTGPEADANLDAGLPPGASPAPDGIGFCCAADMPGCGCQFFGSYADTASECGAMRASMRLCDVHPDDWTPYTDAYGCNVYSAPPLHMPGRSCFPVPLDAGADAR